MAHGLGEEADELVGAHELRVRVRAGRDEPEGLLCGEDGEEVGERGAGDGREEEMAARLVRGASISRCGVRREKGSLTLTSSAQVRRKARGLSTCSRTSIEVTTSNCFGPRAVRTSSAEVCSYVSARFEVGEELDAAKLRLGSDDACREAMLTLEAEASMPRVFAPSLARLC